MDNPQAVWDQLTAAQRAVLEHVCETNGGGLHVRCKVGDDGYGIPLHGPTRALWTKGLIQGKAGSCETVVHTKEGLAVYRAMLTARQENSNGH